MYNVYRLSLPTRGGEKPLPPTVGTEQVEVYFRLVLCARVVSYGTAFRTLTLILAWGHTNSWRQAPQTIKFCMMALYHVDILVFSTKLAYVTLLVHGIWRLILYFWENLWAFV